MNLFERIKSIFKSKNKEEIKENNLVQYDTSKVFIPKLKDLSEKEQELVKKYMEEINLNNFETILNYAKVLNYKANINTNILIEYLYNLEQEVSKIKLIKEDEELLKKKIELKIQESKINLVESELFKIKNEIVLRLVALSEIEKKYSSVVYEFLGIFGEAKRIKHKTLKRSLNDAINRMKINIITMESQRISIDNTTNNLIDLINTLNINNYLSRVNSSKDLKLEIYEERIYRLTRIFKILFEEELIDKERLNQIINNFNDELEQELINRLAVIDNILDKYIYDNKDKLPLLLEQLNNLEISKGKKEENLKVIEKIELIFDLYKNQVPKEYIELLYEKKFYTFIVEIINYGPVPSSISNPFDILKNEDYKNEIEIYESLFYKEYNNFLNNIVEKEVSNSNYKNLHSLLILLMKQRIKKDDFVWYKEATILNIIFVVNHPELFQDFYIKAIKSFYFYKPTEYKIFEYDENILLNSEHYFCADEELVLETLERCRYRISLRDLYTNNFVDIARIDELIFFFTIMYGKYNIKKAFGFKNHTFEIKEGIKKVIANNDLSNINNLNLVFNKMEPHFNVNDLTKMKLPHSLASLEGLDSFIFDLNRVEEVNIPGNIKIITQNTLKDFKKYIFAARTGPEKIILEEGIEEIGDYAFSKIQYLKEIHLPKSLKYISETAFYHIPFLREVYYYPSLLETLGNNIFDRIFKDYNGQIKLIELEEEKIKVK